MATEYVTKNMALEAVEHIRGAIWEVDIPSPTVPEYIEHHEEMQMLMRICDEWIRRISLEPNEIVLCRDCKHNSLNRVSGNAMCDLGLGLHQIWDFCSRGEMKSGARMKGEDDGI